MKPAGEAKALLLSCLAEPRPSAAFKARWGLGTAAFAVLRRALDKSRSAPIETRDALLYAWLAEAELERGRRSESEACLREAVRLDPRAAWRPFLGGLSEAKLPVLQARRRLERELKLRPCARAWCALGELEAKAGRRGEALRAFDRAVELEPKRAWAWALRGRLRARFDADGAAGDFQRCLSLDPSLGWAWAWSGELLRRGGELEEAKLRLDRGLRLLPSYAPAYAWRGAALLELGRPVDALADLSKAVEADPLYALPRALRAEARLKLGAFQDAFDDMDAAAALDPKHGWVREAREAAPGSRPPEGLDRALREDAGDARARAWRGESWLRLGRLDDALEDLDAAVSLDPGAGLVRAWRGEALRRAGLLESALSELDEAVRLEPRYYPAYGWRARARLALGCLEPAMGDARRGLALNRALARRSRACSQAAWLRALWAELLALAGRPVQAARALAEARALDPRDPQAGRLEAALRG